MKRRGVALIYQMLVTVIVVMLVAALLSISQFQMFSSQTYRAGLQAQYAAESGITTVVAKLGGTPGWTGSFSNQLVGTGDSTFSLKFGSSSAADESVNNLTGHAPLSSYLGPVPPGSALLICTGRSQGLERTVETFVVGGADLLIDSAVASSGRIDLTGDVYVDGYDSLASLSKFPTGLHSNGTGPKVIQWHDNPANSLSATGKLTTPSTASNAIDLGTTGTVTIAGSQNNAPYRKLARVDISGLVSSHAVSPETLPSTGSATLAAGDHYFSSNQVLNGDLVLAPGAKVYVDGNFKVNGSVKGKGVLVVNGDTSLFGDSDVLGDKTSNVALLSKGNVTLAGYDGTQHLDALAAADPPNSSTPRGQEVGELWQDVRDSTQWLQTFMKTNGTSGWNDLQMDQYLTVLGPGSNGWAMSGLPSGPNNPNLPTNPKRNSTGALMARLDPNIPTERFLKQRLQSLSDLCRAADYDSSGNYDPGFNSITTVNAYVNGNYNPATMDGLFDAGQSLYATGAYATLSVPDKTAVDNFVRSMVNVYQQFDYDRIGAAQFRGLVYSQGAILAKDEITVVGAVLCNGDSTWPALVDGSNTVPAGGVYLENGSRLTYVQQMLQAGMGSQ